MEEVSEMNNVDDVGVARETVESGWLICCYCFFDSIECELVGSSEEALRVDETRVDNEVETSVGDPLHGMAVADVVPLLMEPAGTAVMEAAELVGGAMQID